MMKQGALILKILTIKSHLKYNQAHAKTAKNGCAWDFSTVNHPVSQERLLVAEQYQMR
jgi:hypothetical protein